jgi:hypothetical protein
MSEMSIIENMQSYGLKKVLAYLDTDPDNNIPKILEWVEKFDKDGVVNRQMNTISSVLRDKDSNWYKLVKSLYTDIDPGVRKNFFENFIINATIIGGKRQAKARAENNCNVPWAILMDPTSACNLHCTGCWAADYGSKMNMDLDTLDSIIEQGKKIRNLYVYLFRRRASGPKR